MKPQPQQPRPSMTSDVPIERVLGRMDLSGSILTGVFRIVLLTWVFVTAVVLWNLR